jgi:DNA modification methylase
MDAHRRVAEVRLVCPRKTKDKLPENITVRRKNNQRGLRGRDGTIRPRANPAASLQPRKIPDSVIRVLRHNTPGIGHPAPFPVDLVAEMLSAFSDAGDVAFEPFCGSGTSIIAAENSGRHCLAMEISPAYCDVAVIRWSKFTGRAAVLADDGRTFDRLAEARGISK